jgi:predicted metalloenzyme YecM
MILDHYIIFIEEVLKKIHEFEIDVFSLEMDHIGYQASSDEDYDRLREEFDKLGERVSEEIVGGRRVGIYKLNNPLQYQQYTIPAIELVAPKEKQICPSALEHVEFVIQESFESFIKRYSNISWDVSAINQKDFPMVKLKLDTYIQVKFHLLPVLEILKHIKHE